MLFFLDEENEDAWYNAGGDTVRFASVGQGAGSYVGSELGFKLTYQVNQYFKVDGGYAHFFAGYYVEDTGDDDDVDWGYLQATFIF